MPVLPFELRSLPGERGAPRLFIVQLPLKVDLLPPRDDIATIGRSEGASLSRLGPNLVQIFSQAGHELPHDLLERARTIPLDEEVALRVALVLAQTDNLRSNEKIEAIVEAIMAMPISEIIYWVEKHREEDNEMAKKALRMMIGG